MDTLKTNEFTDSCKNNIDCKICLKKYSQCFGINCPDFEPFLELINGEL